MSKLYRVIVTPEAQQGLDSAYQRIAQQSPERAFDWAHGFMEAIESLAKMPARCAMAPETLLLNQDIRHLLYGPKGRRYRALFQIEDDVVYVLYIRHYAQDWLHDQG